MMKRAMCETAGSVLGSAGRHRADWFKESEVDLKPLIEKRNRMHSLWIGTGRERDKAKWMRACRDTRSRMRAAKNTWFQKKALEAERGKNGKIVWKCIRDIQHGRRGLVPLRKAVEAGAVCGTLELQHQRWRSQILNILIWRS